ncbi:nucleotidyltransferase [Flavobacterium silvisoli]|uniref:Nucleotidyltransferase n=1 Tax=Flavobacterium silvisoli TaxID=2529433 RepID=A0A4Q9Z4A0_9FLAO|nr:nucleotidyltransferase [Flavobacterium silvisoli]TBX68726.1 nucleotidyltransferase [Flavobacterium silvisoli]
MNTEEKKQFDEILETLGENLDISQTQFDAAVKSYQTVGQYLCNDDSELASYQPEIRPQGSFILGTMIKPICEEDDLDIDLVCQLTKKKESWTQKDLKDIVGNELRKHKLYSDMLDKEGRRCWTLLYRRESEQAKEKYHMDILPSIINEGYGIVLEKLFSHIGDDTNFDVSAIRITDKEERNYEIETDLDKWLKSNPFGYAKWFFNRAFLASTARTKLFSLSESVKPVPTFQKNKLPLQRVVQILKRHRDIMYADRDDKIDKPISIIITTLAARAYNGEDNIIEALLNVVEKMHVMIGEENPYTGERMKWISNPANNEENFADKWVAYPERQKNFYEWLENLRQDLEDILNQRGKGLQFINESMKKRFGNDLTNKTFRDYALKTRDLTETNQIKVDKSTMTMGTVGMPIKKNNFEGENGK